MPSSRSRGTTCTPATCIRAIQAGKAVFVEKPLCLTEEELAEIEDALRESGDPAPLLMVGFNRRFSAAAAKAQEFFADVVSPLSVSIRFNAGKFPPTIGCKTRTKGAAASSARRVTASIWRRSWLARRPCDVFAESIADPRADAIRR